MAATSFKNRAALASPGPGGKKVPNRYWNWRDAYVTSRRGKMISNQLSNRYFGSFGQVDSERLLELINVMSVAKNMEHSGSRSGIVPSAAWVVLRMSRESDGMQENLFGKVTSAASLLVCDPALAFRAADRFIFLRTLPTNVRGDHVEESRAYRRLLSGIMYGVLLRHHWSGEKHIKPPSN